MEDYLFAEKTAINQSWICFNDTQVNEEKCVFLTLQQFQRSNPHEAYFECVILLFLAVLTIPANVWAIVRFKAKRLNIEFLILISALCCYNFLSVIVMIVGAWSRVTKYIYPLGYFGCFISLVLACIINNATSFTFALISYERRSLVLFRKGLKRPPRTKFIVSMLVVIVTFCISFWLGVFIFQDVLQVMDYNIYNTKYHPKSQICTALTYRAKIVPPEMLFGLLHFVIPLLIIGYNYM